MPVKKATTTSKSSAKPAPKKASPARRIVQETQPETQAAYTSPVATPRRVNNKAVIAGIVIVLLFILAYLLKNLFIVALVNGQPIWRPQVISQLEKQGGKQVASTLVTTTLIQQEAAKKNISVSQKEIDDQMKQISDNLSKQGQNLDQALQMQGMTRSDLEEQIRNQKLVEKILGDQISVSDKEVNDYIEKNKSSLPSTGDEKTLKDQVRNQLKQQKLSDKFNTWLADAEKKANILYFVNY